MLQSSAPFAQLIYFNQSFTSFPPSLIRAARQFGSVGEGARIIKKMRSVPFNRIQNISINVDSAVGLPGLCMCTRASIKVIEAGSMKVVNANGPFSISQPDSEARAPKFDLSMNFPSTRAVMKHSCIADYISFMFPYCPRSH
jgi:hypothetical protein